jgi:Tol biopolymer transport system component
MAATSLVSVTLDGTPARDWSGEPSVSADGRYVAFTSAAGNLVAGDTNSVKDVFVRDRQAGKTTRVSVDSAGAQGNNYSGAPSISADGRYVAFGSLASNLVAGDTNRYDDVFVHDLQTHVTSRVSVGPLGVQATKDSFNPAISADGRFVAYESYASNLVGNDTNGGFDVFEYDRLVDYTLRVSVDSNNVQGNGWSLSPSISADGRYVAFDSEASNLVAGDTNKFRDVFVHDRYTWQTDRVTVNANGVQADNGSRFATISADGRYVTFESFASNLVAGDTNDESDVFLADRQTRAVTGLNVLPTGEQDRRGGSAINHSRISADGQFVVFHTFQDGLVPNDTNGSWDIFLRDRDTATTTRVSLTNDGAQTDNGSDRPAISADGRHVAFASYASNIVPDCPAWTTNVFIRDLAG